MSTVFLRLLSLLSTLLIIWHAPIAQAQAHDPIRIGVLAFRNIEQTRQQWIPTLEQLARTLPEHNFELRILGQDALTQAVDAGDLDFILTQPEHYVNLRARHGLAAVVTLMPLAEGHPVNQFGGVILVRSDHPGIKSLTDIAGKRVAAVQEHSLGAYRMQQWTLAKAGITLPDDVDLYFTGQPQDKTVFDVLNGKADVAFVRTGILEAMVREQKISPDSFRIINQQPDGTFPQYLSTDLYPEWPFSAARHVPEPLVKAITLALLEIRPESQAARSGKYYGFSPPVDYSTLEAVMLRLRVHPDRFEHFDWQDVLEKYPRMIISGLIALLLLSLAALAAIIVSHRQTKNTLEERAILLDCIDEGIFGVNHQGLCTFINPKALAMLGFTQQEVIGQNQHLLFHHHHNDGTLYPAGECPISQTLADGTRREGEETFFRKDGSPLPVAISVTPATRYGEQHGAVVAFHDISEQRHAQEEMRIAAIAFQTQEAILITDQHSHILRVNEAFTAVTGYSAEEAIGQTPALLKSGRHDPVFYEAMWQALNAQGHWQGEVWNRRKNGEIYPEWLTISAVSDQQGETSHYVAAFLDITQRKLAEEKIEFLAYYDPLTNLPNRRLLHDSLLKAIVTSHRHQRHGALFFIDIDNFKTLNDSLGHDMGDLLLQEVASRLKSKLRITDTIARLGGDEFVVILEDLSSNVHEAIGQVEHLGELLLAELARPYQLRNREFRTTASIGTTLFLDPQETVEHLLKSADMAMYQAKSSGKNALRFFDPAMQVEVEHRMALEHDLRQALERQQLVLHYQAQVDQQGQLIGAEALVRWHHPERGLIPPNDFIPLAEETGLIVPIGRWVLETACQRLAEWKDNPQAAHLTLAVNVSALQFRHRDFVPEVQHILATTGAPANRLKLEITESLLLDEMDTTIDRMHALKAMGLGFSLDDFGTGYSSLTYLKRLPLDQVKIDRSFVNDVLSNPNDATIAQTVIALGKNFGLTVIAEGVEQADQHSFLAERGCESFQGFLFGRPVSASELDRRIRAIAYADVVNSEKKDVYDQAVMTGLVDPD